MLENIKRQLLGLTYLLSHPVQLRHIVIRETLYRQRHRSKQDWVEWQKYDTHSSAPQHSTSTAYARPINVARIQIFSELVRNVGVGLRILDVGCGDGVISEPMSRMGNNVTSVDLPTITILAQKRRVSSVVAGDAEHLAFASNSFDVVLASEVVEHLWDPHSFFDEAFRVLKTEGYIIIEAPEGEEGLRYDSHKNYFTVEVLERVLGARFVLCEVKRLKPAGVPTHTIIVLFRKLNGSN